MTAVEVIAPATDAGDVLDIVDERTRLLLERRPSARRGWLLRRSLLAADVIGLTLAFAGAASIYGSRNGIAARDEWVLLILMLPVWVVVAKIHGLYDRDEERADNSTVDDVVGVFHLVTIGAWILLAGALLSGVAQPGLPKLVAFWTLAVCLVPLMRAAARAYCRRTRAFVQNTVIVGAGDIGQLVARKLLKHPEYGLNLVGFVDSRPKARRADLPAHLSVLGPPARLPEIIGLLDVERVVVSFSNETTDATLELVRELSHLNVQVDVVPRLFEVVGPNVCIHTIEGLPIVGLPPARLTPSSRLIKRTIDVIGASLCLLVTAPLLGFVAWRIRRDSPGPVLFRQRRLGYHRRTFTALKFRTMRVGTDASAHKEYIAQTMAASAQAGDSGLYKLERHEAITGPGRWLRRTSLDELPQLINVLKGDMSLVGPRPCIPYETEYFAPHHFERFLVPQGMTGLWQVTARANSTFGEALDMDVAYVRGWSVGLDLRLLLRTPRQLLRQRGATA